MWGEKKQPVRFAQKIIMLKMDAFGVPFTGLQVLKAFGVAFTCLWGFVRVQLSKFPPAVRMGGN